VTGSAPVGSLDEDLRGACLRALTLSREACRAFALKLTWQASARAFLYQHRQGGGPQDEASRGAARGGLSGV